MGLLIFLFTQPHLSREERFKNSFQQVSWLGIIACSSLPIRKTNSGFWTAHPYSGGAVPDLHRIPWH